MRILALDTTTRTGSVALVEGDVVVDERAGDPARTHAERLPAEITTLVAAHGLALPDIDLYAVASGPGSFTGLRIGIATIQGLAIVHRRNVAAVSALDALAHLAGDGAAPGTLVAAWMDAHRREVFAALYRVQAGAPFTAARLEELEGPTVGDPSATLARWAAQFAASPSLFAGDGAALYAETIARAAPAARITPPGLIAAAIGRLATTAGIPRVEPGAIRPLYVRRPDAEIARDEKLRAVDAGPKAH
jgi:tRNA threonylcarbamoyladenosine biosynthesis protein TsaB